ncbi:MAG: 3'-5' exonuclease [Dehalococcoidia bacterium]|jgi:DNA polymerase III epsilon subunit-like protein|nr:3'-5' exonuclease [Dehalococcoidia bacterium]
MHDLIVIVDTETTGFDPVQHEVIDTHAVLVDQSLKVLFEAGGRSPLLHPERASAQALQVNGWSRAEWAKTERPLIAVLPPVLALIELADWWLGSFPSFDVRFVAAACRSVGFEPPRAKKMIDIKDVAKAAHVCGAGKRPYSLEALCQKCGITLADTHSARVDCYATLGVYMQLRGVSR